MHKDHVSYLRNTHAAFPGKYSVINGIKTPKIR